jgi:hypothetical protein
MLAVDAQCGTCFPSPSRVILALTDWDVIDVGWFLWRL